MTLELVLFVGCVAIVNLGWRIVEESERVVVFRLGRPLSVLQPGLRWIIPVVDKTVRVDLGAVVPGWAELPADDVDQKLLHLAGSGQLQATL